MAPAFAQSYSEAQRVDTNFYCLFFLSFLTNLGKGKPFYLLKHEQLFVCCIPVGFLCLM